MLSSRNERREQSEGGERRDFSEWWSPESFRDGVV